MLYKVVRVYKDSARKVILEKNLTEDEARRCLKYRYSNTKKSMVIYAKMYTKY